MSRDSDCLGCMERFVDEHASSAKPADQFSDFRKVLSELDRHPNEKYFSLKSIIIGNLYGVDIMAEAVEICKLRLFLKLVAQVENVNQIEPLPDIDFNIRCGNALVGYATKQDARRAFTEAATGQGKLMLDNADEAYDRFEENAEVVDRAFKQFRREQTSDGEKVTLADKKALRQKLSVLQDELDRFLASDYGVKPSKKAAFQQWCASHQPFHWFVEFYGIMRAGGFSVIVGNPPYLEVSKLQGRYSPVGFETGSCRDIYAWVVERSCRLKSSESRMGLIVPVSIVSSQSFSPARDIVHTCLRQVWWAHFANRPAQLFHGAQNRLTIVLGASAAESRGSYSTRYHRWDGKGGERDALIPSMTFAPLEDLARKFHGLYPKVGSSVAAAILRRIHRDRPLVQGVVKQSKFRVFWVRVPGYFCQFFLEPPKVRPEKGGASRPRGELNDICAEGEEQQRVLHACLNSSLYYQFFSAYTDGRHINPSDVGDYPLDTAKMTSAVRGCLVKLSKELEVRTKLHTSRRRKSGLLIDSLDSSKVKPLLDQIDTALAEHYGFGAEYLDFIINYDIKYRVGADEDAEGDEG